jgi:hypothetical protein
MQRRICVVLLAVLAWSSRVSAAESDADDLIRQGVELRRKGDDAAALEKFEAAYQLSATARARAQIGLAEQALGRWAAAYEHLTDALADKADRWIEGHRSALSAALDEVEHHVGRLQILGGSQGAEVRLDGVPKGTLPLSHPIVVPAGTVTIQLAAPGFETTQRSVMVRPRALVRESFEALTPSAEMPAARFGAEAEGNTPVGRSGAVPSATATPAVGGGAQSSRGEPEPSLRAGRHALKWIAWGAGAVGLGVGIFGLVRQRSAGADFDGSGCRIDASGQLTTTPTATRSLDDCRALQDRVDSGFTIEVIGLTSAAALAAAGVVLWLTEPTAERPREAAMTCAPSFIAGRQAGLSCGWRF